MQSSAVVNVNYIQLNWFFLKIKHCQWSKHVEWIISVTSIFGLKFNEKFQILNLVKEICQHFSSIVPQTTKN